MAKKKPNYRDDLYRKTFTYNGKKYYVTAKDPNDLERKAIIRQMELERGDAITNDNSYVKKWISEWLEVYKKPNIQESSYNKMLSIVENHILPNIGHYRLKQIKPPLLQALLNKYSGESFSKVSKIKIYINEIFECAEKNELLSNNPARFLELPKTTKGKRRILTDTEYNAVIEVCKTHRAGFWVLLMLTCGLRRGETVSLTWPDFDFKNKMIFINKSVEFVKGVPKLKDQPKTKAGTRLVGMSDDIYYMAQAKKENSGNTLVFSTPVTKQMMNETYIRRMWSSFKRDLDIYLGAELYRNEIIKSKLEPNLTIHCLRHTCITRLLENGASPKDVQVFAGHEDISTTLNIYTHIESEHAAARIIEFQGKNELNSGTSSGTI